MYGCLISVGVDEPLLATVTVNPPNAPKLPELGA